MHTETAVAHLCVFYLKLCHLYEVLPEGHNSPAFENSELCFGEGGDKVQFKMCGSLKDLSNY